MELSCSFLESSSKALASFGAPDDVAELEKLRDVPPEEPSMHFEGNAGAVSTHCETVADSTLTWLRALDAKHQEPLSGKAKFDNFVKIHKPLILRGLAPPMLQLKILFTTIQHPTKQNIRKTIWMAELVAGFVALFCMSTHWDNWGNFRLSKTQFPIGAKFSGWELLGCSNAFQATSEGTVKKGIQRVLGTCVGGFLAWLGVIVASWSNDDCAPINSCGLVAWLTVMTFSITLTGVEKGMEALMGKDCNHGHTVHCVQMTPGLISLETVRSKGSKEDLTVNRVTATVAGVITAMVVAAIPPCEV